MEIRIVGSDGLAEALGLPPDADGGPSRRGLADWMRDFVSFRGVIPMQEVLDRATAFGVAAGYAEPACRKRAEGLAKLLVAMGDVAAIETGQGRLIVPGQPLRVALGNAEDALVGAPPDSGRSTLGPAHCVVRRSPAEPGSISLADFLGCPEALECLGGDSVEEVADLRSLPATLRATTAARVMEDPTADWERVAALPSGDLVLLAGRSGAWALGRRSGEGFQPVRLLEQEDQPGWLYLWARGMGALIDWPQNLEMPTQVLRALGILATPLDDALKCWSIPDEAREFLTGWLGLEEAQASARDPAQDRVVHAKPSARLLVEAPPGTGKTWTACRRVGQLVNYGVAPTRILLLSFTRAAVAEIKDRIAGFLDEPDAAADITVLTLDALVWRLLRAAENAPGQGQSGYDASVSALLACFARGERGLLQFVRRLEHLIVDEAQDLTGDRRDLVGNLIRALSPECGATVFLDPAQAIYGFTTRQAEGIADDLARSGGGFERMVLERDYRTQTPTLQGMIRNGRDLLAGCADDPREVYRKMRDLVECSSAAKLPAISAQEFSPSDGRTFVLFRSRAEVLAATNDMLRAGRRFQVRSGSGIAHVQPWAGAVLSRVSVRHGDQRQLMDAFAELGPIPPCSFDEMWSLFRRTAPAGGAEVDFSRLAEVLSSPNPPSEFIRTDLGFRSGPLLSTVHAAKGREADTVHLMLPRWPEWAKTDWEEEARILFVGASRARKTLRTGVAVSGLRPLERPSRRRWRPFTRYGANSVLVEVGLPGDIDLDHQLNGSSWGGEQAMADGLDRLWHNAYRPVRLRAIRSGDRYRLELDEGNSAGGVVGWLSKQFTNDLWELGGEVCGSRTPPPASFGGLWMLAADTISSPVRQSDCPQFGLAPVVTGTPLVQFPSRS